MDDEDDDWLVSSDDERGAGESAGLGREAELGMGGRDAAKVKNKMADVSLGFWQVVLSLG